MIYTTRSGSVYEVDDTNLKIRRLTGSKDPTERQGKNGEWKAYHSITLLNEGLLINWDGDIKCTLTSPIVKVEARN